MTDREWFLSECEALWIVPTQEQIEEFIERVAIIWCNGTSEQESREIAFQGFQKSRKLKY